MSTAIEHLRNIGIIAHIDAGKTTTTERILFYAGASHAMGDVDEGTTQTDFDPEEQQRGITIYSAAVTCQWQDKRINIIDTPGHVDFTAEVERSLRVLDGAIVIFSAREGVEAQSETVWRQANKYKVPRLCYINKMDRIGAEFDRVFGEIVDRLTSAPVAIQIPCGSSNEFRGVIDLIEMQLIEWVPDTRGKDYSAGPIPEEWQEKAKEWRHKLLEAVALLDDAVLTKYMEEDDIPKDDIHRLLRVGTLQGTIQPVLCGSSLNYVGVQPLLDAVVRYLPNPTERPPVEGVRHGGKHAGTAEVRKPSAKEPFCGLIFKIQSDAHGDLCFVRVYSGVLKGKSRHLNPRTNKKELISQLWHIQADRREKLETDEVSAGDIVGVLGPKDSATGDTLCDGAHPIALESITFPEPVISMAVEPESSADRKKLADTLAMLSRQDPTFRAKVSEETGQTLISGMGELHLEVIRHRIQRDFKLNVRVHKPRVSYRETIKKKAEAEGVFSRTVTGVTQTARLKLRLEPYHGAEAVALENDLKPGALPKDIVPLVEQTVIDEARNGGQFGYPLIQVKITLLDAGAENVDQPEAAFQAAAMNAVREAIDQAGVKLLEPIMKLEVVTPEEFLGNIHENLRARRAVVTAAEQRGGLHVITAEAPLAGMFGYSSQVRSLSQGRASYSMEPLRYDEAPPDVLESMM
jgi:elongation factor G